MRASTTGGIMAWVLCALLPGIAAMTWVWGWGVLWNVVLLSIACVACELASLLLRGLSRSDVFRQLTDGSALVTAWLIAIALPPFAPAGVLLVAAAGAVGVAKHAYGGLGSNLFNPAMVGYAIVLLAFPQHLADWPLQASQHTDALSGATVLTDFRFRSGLTVAEFELARPSDPQIIAWAFLAGGMLLMLLRLIAWRIPLAIAVGVGLCAAFGYDNGSSSSLGGWWFHLSSGGLMTAALFVATDPVTHPSRPAHQMLFGLMIGMLIYLLRAFGTQPDAIAFAILLGNCVTPLFNRFAHKQAELRHAER